MTRRIERGIPWPEGVKVTRKGWQRGPSFENFLKRQGIEIGSSLSTLDFRLLEQFYRYRQRVNAGVLDPSCAARRFERLVRKVFGEEDNSFYERNRDLLNLIAKNTSS